MWAGMGEKKKQGWEKLSCHVFLHFGTLDKKCPVESLLYRLPPFKDGEECWLEFVHHQKLLIGWNWVQDTQQRELGNKSLVKIEHKTLVKLTSTAYDHKINPQIQIEGKNGKISIGCIFSEKQKRQKFDALTSGRDGFQTWQKQLLAKQLTLRVESLFKCLSRCLLVLVFK